MLHPHKQQQPPAEFHQLMATQLTQRIIDQLDKLGAPSSLINLALSLSYFQDPQRSPGDLAFFIGQATQALAETGGL